jgi:NAD(P)-dependent dehydrogenase (short-subunit alcohol dehydrogenase family)
MGMLDDKVAIITGATSGIGRRIAEVYVAEGAQVVVAARREDEGKQLERELGKSAHFISTDVSDAAQVKAMVDCAIDAFGQVDCLVNNAGSPSPMVSIVDVDMDNYEQVMAINVRGVMLGIKLVIPHMLRQGSGSIINISSGSALRVSYSAHTYVASKAAVTHLTRSVAAEVGANGIRVNSISPGGVATGIFGKNDPRIRSLACYLPRCPFPSATSRADTLPKRPNSPAASEGFAEPRHRQRRGQSR